MFGPAASLAPLRTFGTDDAIAFLEGHGVDGSGRKVEDYFNFDNDKWEECHNHVQWAFPSNIRSDFNMEAPVVDLVEFAEKISVDGLINMLQLVGAYLNSLGFKMDDDGEYRFDPASERNMVWITPHNHNYRRISRLLNVLSHVTPDLSISLLRQFSNAAAYGMAKTAIVRDEKMNPHVVRCIDNDTLVYWNQAAFGIL